MHFVAYVAFLLSPCALAHWAALFYRQWDGTLRPVWLFLEMLALSLAARAFIFATYLSLPPFDGEFPWNDLLIAAIVVDWAQVAVLWLLRRLFLSGNRHWSERAAGLCSYSGRISAVVVGMSVAFYFVLSAGWAVVIGSEDAEWLIHVLGASLVTGGFLALFFSGRISWLWRLDYLRRESVRTIERLNTSNPPVVFLRSFEIDKHIFMGHSVDEFLCRNSAHSGDPVVSLGDPNGALPSGGSVKILASNDRWKDVVVELLRVCKAVVLVEGLTEGLHWEIKNVKEYVLPERFFVVTLPTAYRMRVWCRVHTFAMLYHLAFHRKDVRQALEFVWGKFRRYLSEEGFAVPEDDPGGGKILLFDRDWRVKEVVTPRRPAEAFVWISNRTRSLVGKRFCDYNALACRIVDCLADADARRTPTRAIRIVGALAFLLVAASVVACLAAYVCLKLTLL